MCVGTFTFGHVKPHALDEFVRITKKDGLICFTINEGIYVEYGFDKKIDTLKKEGGASGLAPLYKALKDKGHDMSAKEVISKMSDVKQHKEGDYILEKMDEVDPKAVKKKFKDRKDQDIDNDGDVDSSDEYLHKTF